MSKKHAAAAGLIALTLVGLVVASVVVLRKEGEARPLGIDLLSVRLPADKELSNVPAKATSRLSVTPGVERWYTHTKLKFSFRLPDGFNAPEVDTGTPDIQGVHLYNDAGSVLEIRIYPIVEGSSISEKDIRAYLPGVTVSNVHEKFVSTVVRGLSYSSNSPEWGGDGIGFWIAYNGHLYTLESQRSDQELMDFVLSNWYFAPPVPSTP